MSFRSALPTNSSMSISKTESGIIVEFWIFRRVIEISLQAENSLRGRHQLTEMKFRSFAVSSKKNNYFQIVVWVNFQKKIKVFFVRIENFLFCLRRELDNFVSRQIKSNEWVMNKHAQRSPVLEIE